MIFMVDDKKIKELLITDTNNLLQDFLKLFDGKLNDLNDFSQIYNH